MEKEYHLPKSTYMIVALILSSRKQTKIKEYI